MRKLSDEVKFQSVDTFRRCQICGYESTDICEFRMLEEHDEKDRPTPARLVVCQSDSCKRVIEEHPRLYSTLQWGTGSPGCFMTLCGDCEFRRGFSCTHSDLKANGGPGLVIKFAQPMGLVTMCSDSGCRTVQPHAVSCEGWRERDAQALS